MEFLLRAQLARAEDRYSHALKASNEADLQKTTTKKIAEHMFDLFRHIKMAANERHYPGPPGQQESDLHGVEKTWLRVEGDHKAAIDHSYECSRQFREAQIHFWDLRECLENLMSGKDRWEKIDAVPRWHDEKTYKTFHDAKGTAHHFVRVAPTYPHPRYDHYSRTEYSSTSPPRERYGSRCPTPPPRSSPSPPLYGGNDGSRRPSFPRFKTSPPPQATAGAERPPPPMRPELFRRGRPEQSVIEAWFEEIDRALANPSKLRAFPQPPRWVCERERAGGPCAKHAFWLCGCVLSSLFQGRDLKAERFRFHPDKYSRVPEAARQAVQREAGEMFKWVDGMYADSQARGERRQR